MHTGTHRLMDTYGFTVTCCGKCSGLGTLPGYEFSDGARCWKCMRRGYYLTPKRLEARSALIADMKAGKRVDITAYWKESRSKVEPDIADALIAQVEARNAKLAHA